MTNNIKDYLLNRFRVLFLNLDNKISVSDEKPDYEGIVKAITMNDEINQLGYCLSENSFNELAKYYSDNTNKINIFNELNNIINVPTAKSFYPDFPSQVINEDELSYRLNQMAHYFSTYGIEEISNQLGVSVIVKDGWLPNIKDTNKTKDDISILNKKILNIFFKEEDLIKFLYTKLMYKNERLKSADLELLFSMPLNNINYLMPNKVQFRENLLLFMNKILNYKSINYKDKGNLLYKISKHPTDIAKLIDYNKDTKYTTSQKRTLVYTLEKFPYDTLYNNMSDNIKLYKRILQRISFNKFSKKLKIKELVRQLRNNELKSWNSRKELAYKNKNHKELLNILSKKPGILIRELRRLLKNDVQKEDILNILKNKKLSLFTLMNIINNEKLYENLASNHKNNLIYILKTLIKLNIPVVKEIENKNLLLLNNNIILDKSIIQTNTDNYISDYIEPGLSYEIPKDAKILRFFIYWNDSTKRVDLDLHSYGFINNDELIHIGWNGYYNDYGITTSGDITTSNNSIEYIDINISKAKEMGIQNIITKIDNYTNEKFSDIQEAYCGLLAVNNTNTNTKQFNIKNAIFKVDLTKIQGNITWSNIAKIDLNDNSINYLLNKHKINKSNIYNNIYYSVNDYILDLARKNNAAIIASKDKIKRPEDAILTITRTKSDDNISLLDNNWFIEF